MEYRHCYCPHCEQKIEFPTEYEGQLFDCPSCNGAMTLPERRAEKSVFALLKDRISEVGKTVKDKRKLKALLCEILEDGVLTPEEVHHVQELMEATGLTFDDISRWKRDLFKRAMKGVQARGATSAQLDGLTAIQRYLTLPDSEVPQEISEIRRWRWLVNLREHGPSPIEVHNVVLRKGEICYWEERATLYEEKVVRSGYQGGSRGVSIRVMRGVSFRVGNHRGNFVSEKADMPVAEGSLVVTNRRLIFRGDRKSFESKFEKVLELELFRDGIFYSESNRQKRRMIKFQSNNGEVVGEIIQAALSRFEEPPKQRSPRSCDRRSSW